MMYLFNSHNLTGGLAITIANPTDLVKVRLQSEGKLPPGVPRRYSGSLNAYSTIVRQVEHLALICILFISFFIIYLSFICLMSLSNFTNLYLKFRRELELCGLGLDRM